jgi:hypothetical protein
MGEVLGFDTGVSLPGVVNSSGSGLLIWVALIAVIGMIIGIGLYLYVMNKKFNKKIILFENIAGKGWEPTLKDRARVVKIGDGGEEILFLRKSKVFRTAYARKMGKNTYWFAVGQDGYWYNFLLGDLDAKMGMLDIEPVDRDMRYMHVAIRKNITERYRKVGFMEKYGVMVFSGIFIIAMIIALWLMLDQIGELIEQAAQATSAGAKTLEVVTNALARVDSICAGGSGISAA